VKALVVGILRVRVHDAHRIPPTGSYILCFNHPSWFDPFVVVGCWPDRTRRLFVLGPRERDMTKGVRNRLIAWSKRSVPFMPEGRNAIDLTRRAIEVLRHDTILAAAGEGRLSDHESEPLPVDPGLGHLAIMARVPVVPVALVGTRWMHWRKEVHMRVGEPVMPEGLGKGRLGAQALASEVHARLVALLEGVEDTQPPNGRLARWFSELFNERPWLDEAD
jgi:1-acyl-sn-glycerol-3-phosphate acyltransferase